MKIRKGFVSNSSSSSFVVGVTLIKDESKLLAYAKKHKLYPLDKFGRLTISTIADIMEGKDWNVKYQSGYVEVESFKNSVSIEVPDVPVDRKILYIDYTGNEGDSAFQSEHAPGEWPEIDYDIDASFFDEGIQRIITLFSHAEEAGLDPKNCSLSFGAGRNG